MWMKPVISSWILTIFFLISGLATNSHQLGSYAEISAGDFVTSDRLDDSTRSSTIRRFRTCGRKLVTVHARTVTASEISFQAVLSYGTIHLRTHSSNQNLRTFNVVLQI
jgi:hypothetical protein